MYRRTYTHFSRILYKSEKPQCTRVNYESVPLYKYVCEKNLTRARAWAAAA